MPYLVSVSGNRIPLRRGHTYVIGRGLDCDVILEDAACSRRHSRVAMARATDSAFLEDLGSRNGTYLNGEPVRSRIAVRDGGRIQIGGSIFLVRLKEEPDEVDLAETGTVAYETTSTMREDIDGGELSQDGILDLIKLLFNGRRNARVHLALPHEHAVLEVRAGEVLYAEYAGLEGFNALVKLGRQPTGIFWLVETDAACERNINEPVVRLLSELSRCIDPSAASRQV